MSSDGKIDWYSRSNDFYIRHFEKGETLPKNSLTYGYYRKVKKKGESEICLATDWDPTQKQDKYFYEDCFYFDKYNSAITYLWVCDEY